MREFHKQVYWNLIWYFTEIKVPYEFLIPYDWWYLGLLAKYLEES